MDLQPDSQRLLKLCVHVGTRRGYRQAHQQSTAPSEEQLCRAIERAIDEELQDWFRLSGPSTP